MAASHFSTDHWLLRGIAPIASINADAAKNFQPQISKVRANLQRFQAFVTLLSLPDPGDTELDDAIRSAEGQIQQASLALEILSASRVQTLTGRLFLERVDGANLAYLESCNAISYIFSLIPAAAPIADEFDASIGFDFDAFWNALHSDTLSRPPASAEASARSIQ